MSMTSQDSAGLTEHSYDRKQNMRQLVGKEVTLEGGSTQFSSTSTIRTPAIKARFING